MWGRVMVFPQNFKPGVLNDELLLKVTEMTFDLAKLGKTSCTSDDFILD